MPVDDGWVPVKEPKANKFASSVQEVKTKGPMQSPVMHENTIQTQNPGSAPFDFDWAEDVSNAFGDVCTVPNSIDPPERKGEYLIAGGRYRYAQGASRQVPKFSVHTSDSRYEYENSDSTLASPPMSPKRANVQEKPMMPVAETLVQKKVWSQCAGKKSRARYKKHTLPTPAVRPAYEYEEAQAIMEDFIDQAPNVKNLLERVDQPVVEEEEDLWADYKNKPSRPIFYG